MRAFLALCALLAAIGGALAQQTIPAVPAVGSMNSAVVTYQAAANWVPTSYAVTGYCSTCSTVPGNVAHKSWQFQALTGPSGNQTWTVIDSQTAVAFADKQKLTFPLVGAPAGSQWRLVITSNDDPLINVVELDVIGSPSVAAPPPRPPVTFAFGWTDPSPFPSNDAVPGAACSGLDCWNFFVGQLVERQGALLTGGAYDLFVGDSITALCDATQASPFAVNAGISGNTVNGVVGELSQMWHSGDTYSGGTSLAHVHALVLNVGVNDVGALGSGAAVIEGKLQVLFNAWSGPLVWTGIWPTPSNTGWKTEIDQVNAWASTFLAGRPHTHDLTSQIGSALSVGGFMNPSYQLVAAGVAGIHYNGAGCAAAMAVEAASLQQPF